MAKRLAEARDEHNVAPQDVEEVTVTIHPQYLDVCNIWEPATGLEAKFSYRLTTALCLYGYKTASLDTYTDEICREPALVALRNRVKVATDDSMTSTAARVDVTAGNGNTTSIDHDIATPLPLEKRQARVMEKAKTLIGAQADNVHSKVAMMETSNKPFKLTDFLND